MNTIHIVVKDTLEQFSGWEQYQDDEGKDTWNIKDCWEEKAKTIHSIHDHPKKAKKVLDGLIGSVSHTHVVPDDLTSPTGYTIEVSYRVLELRVGTVLDEL